MTSNVPRPSFTDNGFLVPLESAILSGTKADINAALNGGINMADETPQGQIAVSMAASIGDKNDTFLAYINGVDPAFSSGRMQDAIGRIYFQTRIPATATVAQCTLSGATGTIIPVGASAIANDGNIYFCQSAGTIGTSGNISLPFACAIMGPIACSIGNVASPYKTILGWDSITNPLAGAVGRNVETASQFETRRRSSVFVNSSNFIQSVRAAILAVNGVTDCYVTDNSSASAVTVGGYTIAAHSVFVSVVGGLASDIAQAIWTKKAPGCGYNGSTTVTVSDTTYNYPYPTYQISFEYAQPITISFTISIVNSSNVPANALDIISAAVINSFLGLDGGPRATIGSTIFASRFYAAVSLAGSWVQLISIKINGSLDELAIGIDQIPVTSEASITVTLV